LLIILLLKTGLYLLQKITGKAPEAVYDMSHSPLLDALTDAATTLKRTQYLFGPDFWTNPATANYFDGDAWYYPGRNLTRGNITSLYSSLLEFPDHECLIPSASTFQFKQVILLTNGYCGSTCAIFTTYLKKALPDMVETIVVGGIKSSGESISYSTFPGGVVKNDVETIKWINDLSLNNNSNAPKPFPYTTSLSYAFPELYLNPGDPYPEEFTFFGADRHIWSWPYYQIQSQSEELYQTIYDNYLGHDKPSNGDDNKIVYIILAVVAGVIVLGIVGIVVYKKVYSPRQGYHSLH
jgi:hypothetical protein